MALLHQNASVCLISEFALYYLGLRGEEMRAGLDEIERKRKRAEEGETEVGGAFGGNDDGNGENDDDDDDDEQKDCRRRPKKTKRWRKPRLGQHE